MLRARPRSVTSPRRGLRPGSLLRATPLSQGSLDDGNEALFSKGLRHTRVGLGSVCFAIEVAIAADGHHDDGDSPGPGAMPEDPADLVAVHARHLEIQEDDVRRVGVGQGKPLHAARRAADLVILGFEDCSQEGADLGVVLNHQHTPRPSACCLR